MIFIPVRAFSASASFDGKNETPESFPWQLTPGDIYFVIEFSGTDYTKRSLILHPQHGPCWTFVSSERGTLLGDFVPNDKNPC
jgi:hypothetical protein